MAELLPGLAALQVYAKELDWYNCCCILLHIIGHNRSSCTLYDGPDTGGFFWHLIVEKSVPLRVNNTVLFG